MKILELTGKRFGRLTALFKTGKRSKGGRLIWHCVCDCGKECDVPSTDLVSGNTKSCGCLQPEKARNSHLKHGDCPYGKKATKLYSVWSGMKNRCNTKSHVEYKNYGGRGIKVCDEWLNNYSTFKEWALSNCYKEGLQIDRIDNNQGYSPENCRFVTRKENGNNKSTTIRINFQGKERTITEIAEMLNLPRRLIYQRIYNGWEINKLDRPPRQCKR